MQVLSRMILSSIGITATFAGGILPAWAQNSVTPVVRPTPPGNSNPDNNFRFDPTPGVAGGYVFNLKTTGLGTGTYNLGFTAGSDPTVHTVSFQVK